MSDFNTILKEAARLAEQDLAEQDYLRFAATPDIETSKEFDERVDKIIISMEPKTYSKPSAFRKTIRTFIAIAAIIAIFSISATGGNPFMETVKDFFIRTFTDGSIVRFEDNDQTVGTLYSNYTWIPDGYELVEHEQDEIQEIFVFEDHNKNQLICITRKSTPSKSGINTEDALTDEIYINNLPGLYYEQENFIEVIWNTGEYYYYINAESKNISKEDLIRIAESRENVY